MKAAAVAFLLLMAMVYVAEAQMDIEQGSDVDVGRKLLGWGGWKPWGIVAKDKKFGNKAKAVSIGKHKRVSAKATKKGSSSSSSSRTGGSSAHSYGSATGPGAKTFSFTKTTKNRAVASSYAWSGR